MRSPLVRVEVSKQPGQGGADGIGAPAEQLGNQTHVVIARNAEIPGDGAGQGLVFAGVYIGLNLIADLVSILANPRLRHPK